MSPAEVFTKHAKCYDALIDFSAEYKRAKQEIKKCAADTVRLQKKVKKGECNEAGRKGWV